MDSDLSDRIEQLRNEIIAAAADVGSALESGEEARELAVGQQVEDLVKRYQAAQKTPERDRWEIALGRQITDLRRLAAGLMHRVSGSKTELATDSGLPFLLQRKPGKSIVPERAAPTGKLSVGGEVDAWCGKCKEIRTHNIVAMVGGEAKQVVCQTCSSRHNFRTDPPARARTASGSVPTAVAGTAAARAADKEQQSRQEQKRVLQQELSGAVEPRQFDPKGRYKSGEIIIHPEYGRGKVENVLRTSLLVRFLEGLRPLDLG